MLWLSKDCILARCQAPWKLSSLPLMWIPQDGIHNRLEFLRNSTGSWKSLRDSHSSHRAYDWALSDLDVAFSGTTTRCSGYPLKTRKRQIKKHPSPVQRRFHRKSVCLSKYILERQGTAIIRMNEYTAGAKIPPKERNHPGRMTNQVQLALVRPRRNVTHLAPHVGAGLTNN
jgi:hypothetical protein